MARLGRYFLPGQPQHLIQRGNNRSPIFFDRGDYGFYKDCLQDVAARHGCDIHAYVFMTNHVHLLLSPREEGSIPRTLQSLGRRYVRHVNDRYGRSGTLWEGRYRATVIDSERYLLTCYRYIELNPVRAGLVSHPRDYPWSSYRRHAAGEADTLITDHQLYQALGDTPAERQRAYRALFDEALDPDIINDLRAATNGGWVLGEERFKGRIADAVGRRVAPLPKGRPRKARTEAG